MSSENMVDSEEENVSQSNKGMTFSDTLKFFAKRITFDDPLYGVVTSSYVAEKFAQRDFQPNLEKLSRDKLRKEIIKFYKDSKEELKRDFADLDSGLIVSCDLWTSFNGEDHFLCVICHWVREDGPFNHNVIGFEMLYPCEYVDIASKIVKVLDKFNLKDKINGISFEDGISREKCMEHLVKEFNPVVPEMFYLDRTFVNVVDLCAQQIVDELAEFVNPIRDLHKRFQCSDKKQEFRTLCKDRSPPTFRACFSSDWKSTLHNLKGIYNYKEVFTKLYNHCENHCPLLDSQWDAINSMVNLLRKFRYISDKFIGSYDAVCQLVIEDCIVIVHTLRSYESDPLFGSVVRNALSKWLELFPEIPTIYCVATILDPRIKVEGLRQLLACYYETLGVKYDVDEKVAHCVDVLKQLLAHRAPPCEPEPNLGEGKNKSSSSLEFNVIRDVLKKKRKREDDQEERGELGYYLSYDFEVPDENDLLDWWPYKREYFPVLSKVAKDVLCAPLLTSLPYEKYCLGKRVLDKNRSMLPPGLLNVSICKTDWDLGRKSNQQRSGYDWDYGAFETDFEEDD